MTKTEIILKAYKEDRLSLEEATTLLNNDLYIQPYTYPWKDIQVTYSDL